MKKLSCWFLIAKTPGQEGIIIIISASPSHSPVDTHVNRIIKLHFDPSRVEATAEEPYPHSARTRRPDALMNLCLVSWTWVWPWLSSDPRLEMGTVWPPGPFPFPRPRPRQLPRSCKCRRWAGAWLREWATAVAWNPPGSHGHCWWLWWSWSSPIQPNSVGWKLSLFVLLCLFVIYLFPSLGTTAFLGVLQMKSHKFALLSWHYANCHLCATVCLSGCGIDFTQLVRNDKLPHMHTTTYAQPNRYGARHSTALLI